MKRVALVILGLYVCLIGAVVHRHVLYAGGVIWPWGLVLTIAVTYVVVVASDRATRTGGAVFALGWGAGLLALQYPPGGTSYLVASDWLGWAFTAGCLGVIAIAIVRPPRLWQ